ncbi:MAG TPA: hypothetical protein VGK59_21070 [Ohtaekwangia sp.]
MKNLLIILIITISIDSTYGQAKKDKTIELLSDNQGWYEGSIMLSDGEELKGLVKYNDRNGVLAMHNGVDSRPFSARNVIAFEFFDESLQIQRLFYTLEYEDPITNVKRPQYFEVLRDYKTFVILIKADPIEVSEKAKHSFLGDTYNNPANAKVTLEVSQTETVYILNEKGDIMPYFQVINIEDGDKSFLAIDNSRTKNKMVDKDLLAEYVTTPVFEKLESYAKENDLKFKRKQDFLKILTYYDSIRK